MNPVSIIFGCALILGLLNFIQLWRHWHLENESRLLLREAHQSLTDARNEITRLDRQLRETGGIKRGAKGRWEKII